MPVLYMGSQSAEPQRTYGGDITDQIHDERESRRDRASLLSDTDHTCIHVVCMCVRLIVHACSVYVCV